jgi:hypothetical protein
VADWYGKNQGKIQWGAVIGGWTGAFMMPILAVITIQIARVETGLEDPDRPVTGQRSDDVAVPDAPPLFWGVAAYTAPRKNPEAPR